MIYRLSHSSRVLTAVISCLAFTSGTGAVVCRLRADIVLLALLLPAAILAIISLMAAPPGAEAKNMFYGLVASWCDQGGNKPKRFEITDDGSLIYDWSKGRVCQIKSATNMDEPFRDYIVTCRCETGEFREKLTTFMLHDKDGGRRFLLRREKLPRRGKAETFEHCREP
jgi:hypothetical protein